MAEGVRDAAQQPAVLGLGRVDLRGAEADRAVDDGLRVVGDEQQLHGAAAQRLGAEGVVLGRLVGDPERRVADRELGDDRLVLVGAADAVDLDGPEGRLVELDRLAAAADGELGRDRRYP